MKKRLTIVDGSSYLYRAQYAMSRLSGPQGQPTGAIYGVVNMLRALENSYPADYFAVIFDAPGKNFRHDIYTEYKANRPPTPPEIKEQFGTLRAIIEALGYPIIQQAGVEADDVIGTLARQAAEQQLSVLISTGDKDLAQLVNDDICLLDTMKKTAAESLTDSAQAVIDKFGVAPEQIAQYLALAGDTSDGIPGVPGVGPKTAVKWLNTYGDLEGVIANATKITSKAGQSLQEAIPMLATYLDLTTIRCHLELPYKPQELLRREPDEDKLVELYQECGFKKWLTDMGQEVPLAAASDSQPQSAYNIILSEASLKAFADTLRSAKCFAIDLALSDAPYLDTHICGIALATTREDATYIPLHHDHPNAPQQLSLEQCMQHLAPLLQDDKCKKCVHDLKRITHALANHDIDLRGVSDDVMLSSYLYNSIATNHSITRDAAMYLQDETTGYEDIAGKGAKQRPINDLAVKTAGDYMAERAHTALSLQTFFAPHIKKDGLTEVYRDIEMPLVPILNAVERKGVMIDSQALHQQGKELKKQMQALEEQAYQLVGMEFNIGSPKQIQTVLYDEMQLPVLKKTPKGQPSTDEEVLQQLAADHDLPRLILEHRTASKLISTYIDTLPQMVNPGSGRIHTSYHQAVTATGRLSSSNPNLQNIPIRTAEGRKIRQAFIAPEGYCLLAIDYSQIEMRAIAHLSEDETLIQRFAKGDDIHTATAAEVFDCDPEQVDFEHRRIAKAINFGLIYGMSGYGLARQLNISNSDATAYVNKYFERYPKIKDYMDNTRELARAQGYVATIFGRRLYLPEIHSKNPRLRRYSERTAINAPVQGSAADIIKLAMINVDRDLPKGVSIIMQVHDELVFEVPQDIVEETAAYCSDRMSNAVELGVRFTVDAGIGQNWDEAH